MKKLNACVWEGECDPYKCSSSSICVTVHCICLLTIPSTRRTEAIIWTSSGCQRQQFNKLCVLCTGSRLHENWWTYFMPLSPSPKEFRHCKGSQSTSEYDFRGRVTLSHYFLHVMTVKAICIFTRSVEEVIKRTSSVPRMLRCAAIAAATTSVPQFSNKYNE